MGSEDNHPINRPHVAVLAFPFGTHATPLLSLTRALAVAAPSATFSFFGTAKSNASLSRIPTSGDPIENLRFYDVSDGLPEGHVAASGDPMEEIRLFLRATPGNFRKAMEAAEVGGARVSCVVSDLFLWFTAEMADEIGVPWVPLWTGGPHALVAHVYTDVLRRTIGVSDQAIPARADEHLDFIPPLSALRVRDLPEGIVFGDLDSPFSQLLHRMGKELPRATAVVLNTFQCLHPPIIGDFKTKFKSCLTVGPLNLFAPTSVEPDQTGCISWLDSQDPATVVYIGFGSMMSPPPNELAELAKGLEASGAPFLWSMKEKVRENLPSGFMDRARGRGLIVSWAPQLQVLEHRAVGVFVTHCGWNSVMESITCGIPMIGRPFFGDQTIIARAISHVWEIGVGAEGGVLKKQQVEIDLNLVLRTEEGKKMRERACALKAQAMKAVALGGSSVKDFSSLVEIVTKC